MATTSRSCLLGRPYAGCVLLFAILSSLAPGGVRSVAIGDTICAEGFIMDNECLFINVDSQGRGRLLDSGDITLVAPNMHTLHCLVDLAVCIRGPFFILKDPTTAGGMYTVQYQLNNHTAMLSMARQAGRSGGGCGTCTGGPNGLVRGFRAEVRGVVTALGGGTNQNPTRIDMTSARVSNGLSPVCASEAPMDTSFWAALIRIIRLIVSILTG